MAYSTLGAFFISFAATLTPSFDAFGSYSPDPATPAEGLASPAFNASFGMYIQARHRSCPLPILKTTILLPSHYEKSNPVLD
jgi:hypothetical protein